MNDSINRYIEERIKIIDKNLNEKSKIELKARIIIGLGVLAAIYIALKVNLLATGIGYFMFISGTLINGIRHTKEYYDIKKGYDKEKDYLLKLKNKGKKLSDKEYNAKEQKRDKQETLVKNDQAKMDNISNISSMLRSLAFFGSVVTIIDLKNIWCAIVGTSLFAISALVEMKHSQKLEKEKSEANNLDHDLNIDQIINEYNKEKLVLKETKEEENTNVLSKNIEKVEAIVEALANQKDTEEEKSKVYYKSREDR